MTKVKRDKQPAFLDLQEHAGHISLWVNRTLLPNIATSLQRHQHHSLLDFSVACIQIYRGDITDYRNDDCSIKVAISAAIADGPKTVVRGSVEQIRGATLVFNKAILGAASRAFMGSGNRAIGKIGLEFREIERK